MVPVATILYQGLRESLKYQYHTPKLSKKVKGNGGWMEVRYRYPSPGNEAQNEQFASREIARHHFKTPYPYSRYYVRNFWDPAKEGSSDVTINYMPDISIFTPEQEALFLGYIPGDDLGNQTKNKKYSEYRKTAMSKNDPKVWSEEKQKEMFSDLRLVFKAYDDIVKDRIEVDEWADSGTPPNESKYTHDPNTYMHEYELFYWTSYDMHLYVELEHALNEIKEDMEANGVDTVEGNSNNWSILDSSHRIDQQQELVKSLKQRNLKAIH